MKVGIKGKGATIKWIDETELPIYQKLQEEKQELIDYIQKQIENVKLENVEVVKGLIQR